MNRKDIILISVLINMALLVVLFIGALKPSTSLETASPKLNKDTVFSDKAVPSPPIDQVDHLLHRILEKEEKQEASVEKKEVVVEAPPVKKEANMKEILIRQGDVLEKIARSYHTTVEELMKINHLSDTKLQIGQMLYVPNRSGEKPLLMESALVGGKMKYYVIKNGDNPWTIAMKNGIKIEDLLKLNDMDESKAKRLKPGDKLRIQ